MVHGSSTEEALEAIVRRILERVYPELILLFGSRAAGTAREDSDYDLMLVMRDATGIEAVRRAASDALRAIGLSADVLAMSASEYARMQHDPGLLAYHVARAGRVLYSSGSVPQRTPRPDRVHEELPQEGLALWTRRADADLRIAEHSLASTDPAWDAICFHSHACVEKLLKALIVKSGAFPPRTHELRELLALQAPRLRNALGVAGACALLMDIWPRARYPDAPEPTPDEARAAIGAARTVHRVVRPVLPATSK
jgi:HEPN domain-containing protein/predicted nucleotidyltransferase